ncbi:MAG: hypothetical protein R3F56_00725 [Planctomycetota bacterium]
MRRRLAAVVLGLVAPLGSFLASGDGSRDRLSALPGPSPTVADDVGCLSCHVGIEEMHPGYRLTCTQCHGGDGSATTRDRAHVAPAKAPPNDERVLPLDYDLAWQRFVNPSNLRVAAVACSPCHDKAVHDVHKSLHGTTAGHLGDGFYEHGLSRDKTPVFSVFPVRDEDGSTGPHALKAARQVPAFDPAARKNQLGTHYRDLPRKACMQCHLWSVGRAVDGRLGLDGDYRGEGCAACHVTYADDGRSRSRDNAIDKLEPGHPMQHRFTSRIPTDTCTRCHYGDASIGLHYRGMAQLVPGMPAGPDVEGTTDRLQNGVFYIRDADMTPPDVHHERGLHCIDCHTLADTMGDGDIYPQMDHAVEIECESCHGSFDRVSDLTTSHGRRVPNLRRAGDEVYLISKVTGRRHRVTQVKHVLDPSRPEYQPHAAAAMNSQHARLECYTCHLGFNVDFFGFHFDRNEQFTQLDIISGERTPGRVTTQEKVFATFNQLRLGFNHEGRIAPWIVGFSTIGSAHAGETDELLRQEAPVTAAGLSGITMVPHQIHNVRREARTCADCHRSGAVYGRGSTNFRLTRDFAFGVTTSGLWVVGLDPKTPGQSRPLARLDLGGGVRALALLADEVRGRASFAFVADDDGELATVDLSNPVAPRLAAKKRLLLDPRRLLVAGRHLYVADGTAGLAVLDIDKPASPRVLATLPTVEARALALSWPWLLIADGPGGLIVVDVTKPEQPTVVADVDLNFESARPNDATDVAILFQASRTRQGAPGTIHRTQPRHLAFVACGLDGLRIVDFTEPGRPQVLNESRTPAALRFDRGDVRAVAVNTVFDIGTTGGGVRSQERDYVYALVHEGANENRVQRVYALDVSDPLRPRRPRNSNKRVYTAADRLLVVRTYNAPFLQHFALAPGAGGAFTMVDVSRINAVGADNATIVGGVAGIVDMAVEELALDRLCDEEGRWIKDVSHDGCRYLTPTELSAVLRAQIPPPAPRVPSFTVPGRRR